MLTLKIQKGAPQGKKSMLKVPWYARVAFQKLKRIKRIEKIDNSIKEKEICNIDYAFALAVN